MKLILSFLLITFFYAPTIKAEDLIQCVREKPSFRQFCSIKNNAVKLNTKIKIKTEYNNISLDMIQILETLKIVLSEGEDTELIIPLDGLTPLLKMSINWSDHRDCTGNELWSDRIHINLVEDASLAEHYMARVIFGLNEYIIDTNITTSTFKGWKIEYNDPGHLNVSVQYKFNNQDSDPAIPSGQRIPKHCKMDLERVNLGFDSYDLSRDLSNLKVISSTISSIMLKSSLLHASYINDSHGAVCSISTLAETLRRAEFLRANDPWENLSKESKESIILALEKAIEIGAISSGGMPQENGVLLLWEYFKGDEFQGILEDSCSLSDLDYRVSVQPFMKEGMITNEVAYKNALDFEKQKANLHKVVSAAWAIISVGKFDIQNSKEYEWIINPLIYENLK